MSGTAQSSAFQREAAAEHAWTEDPPTTSLAARFSLMAKAHPDRDAVVRWVGAETRTVSYGDLDRRSANVAGWLGEHIDGDDARVAVLIDDELDHVAALLGVYRAGFTYVPLHSANPAARLSYFVSHSRSDVVIANGPNLTPAQDLFGAKVVDLDEMEVRSPWTDIELGADRLAQILYTSGSTGAPKGVMQSHAFVLDKARSDTALYRLGADDRLGQLFPLSFAAAGTHLYGALCNGASMHVYDLPSGGMHRMAGWVDDAGLTGLTTVSTLFRRAFAVPEASRDYAALRYVFLGAEAVIASDVELFQAVLPEGCVLVHQMGLSETFSVARYMIRSDTELVDRVVPTGYEPPGKQVLLVDEEGRTVPDGETGRMIVRARLMADGYWDDPALTEEAFSMTDGLRTFRTGDLARRHTDGYIVHMGRQDARIKVRGYGVDLVEVERTLLGVPAITEGAVKVWEDGPRVVGYYVGDLTAAELREYFSERVPHYMVPASFVAMDGLPLTDRGKIDRAALPDPLHLQGSMDSSPPSTPTEHRLHGLWAGVLAVPEVGLDASFFDLGGSSIQAYQLVAEVYRELGVELSATSLLEAPTIRKQGELIDSGADTAARSLVTVRSEGAARPLFAVHGRGGGIMYLHKMEPHLDPGRPIYGLQPELAPGVAPEYLTIEQMASHYLAEVRTVQTQGPYLLAGSCYGGLVAAEMARQLESDGELTDMLVLIDPPNHDTRDPAFREAQKHTFVHFRRQVRRRLRMMLTYRRRKKLAASQGEGEQERLDVLNRLHAEARRVYEPGVSNVPTVVYATRKSKGSQQEFWGDVSPGGLEIEELNSNHAELWTPWNRKIIAHMIQARLDAADSDRVASEPCASP